MRSSTGHRHPPGRQDKIVLRRAGQWVIVPTPGGHSAGPDTLLSSRSLSDSWATLLAPRRGAVSLLPTLGQYASKTQRRTASIVPAWVKLTPWDATLGGGP